MNKQQLGALGEETAAQQMISDGYEIISRNFHSRYGEVDIIARGRGCIVFAEVKLRAVNSIVMPAQAVTYDKQRKLILTAETFLMRNPSALQPRFDVVEVLHENGTVVSCNRIENAFQLN